MRHRFQKPPFLQSILQRDNIVFNLSALESVSKLCSPGLLVLVWMEGQKREEKMRFQRKCISVVKA